MGRNGDPRHLTSEQIQELLDNGLSREEEARVREHLSVCSACQGEMEAWSLLFSEIGSLPELEPAASLSGEIMARVAIRKPLVERVFGWWTLEEARGGGGSHLPAERLQDYAEGLLPRRQAVAAGAHLGECEPCRTQARGWERLMGSLSALGHFHPSPGFAQRVMARVRIPAPVPVVWTVAGGRVLAWIRGFLPRTRRGWAVAGGIASAPTISLGALFYLVFSHPLLSVGTFTTYVSWKASAVAASLLSTVGSTVVESVTLFRAYSFFESLARSPLLVGAGGLAFSLMSAVALWVLYRNLVATPSVEEGHARVRV